METQIKDVNQFDAGLLDPGFGLVGQIRPDLLVGSVRAVVLSAEGDLTWSSVVSSHRLMASWCVLGLCWIPSAC
jgi:hypothetical protein